MVLSNDAAIKKTFKSQYEGLKEMISEAYNPKVHFIFVTRNKEVVKSSTGKEFVDYGEPFLRTMNKSTALSKKQGGRFLWELAMSTPTQEAILWNNPIEAAKLVAKAGNEPA